MKKVVKNVLLITSMVLLCFAVGMTASAATYSGECGAEGNNLTWTLDTETGVLKICGIGDMDMYEYPSSIFSFVAPWSSYNDEISSIKIDYGVTSIGDYAFYYCDTKSITIPNSVMSIGSSAIAFDSKLESFDIPDSVVSIGDQAFAQCRNLKVITVDPNNKCYSNDEYGVLYNKDKTILIQYPIGDNKKSYIISNDVITIGGSAFTGCRNIVNISLPNSLINIADGAFAFCENLENISIPNGVTYIGVSAFSGCDIKDIIIPSGVKYINDATFSSCEELISVVIPDSVERIGDSAFAGCKKLKNIIIPEKVTSIGPWACIGCDSLTSIIIPNGVTNIGDLAFFGCENLENVKISDSVVNFGDRVFSSCPNLTSITVDENNKFYFSDELGVLYNKDKTLLVQYPVGNRRTSYIIPDSVNSICSYAFDLGNNLKDITIPKSVKNIDYMAFDDLENLSDIYYSGNAHDWNKIVIDEINHALLNAKIHYNGCKGYSSKITLPTCIEKGYTTYFCECGYSYVGDYVSATGHKDENSDGKCDVCGYDMTEGCNCNCHKDGIANFFFKIMLFFQKLFKINKTCDCGIAHY